MVTEYINEGEGTNLPVWEKSQILRYSSLLDSFPLVGKCELDLVTCFQRTEYGKRKTVTLQGRNKLTKVKITSHTSCGYRVPKEGHLTSVLVILSSNP